MLVPLSTQNISVMRRGFAKTSATLLSAVMFVGSSPEAQATEQQPAEKRSNRVAGRVVNEIGGRILHLSESGRGVSGMSSISPSGYVSLVVKFNSGMSLVPGPNGHYNLKAYGNVGFNEKLDRTDINRVKVSEGSASDGKSLFSVSLFRCGKYVPDEAPWYGGEGTD